MENQPQPKQQRYQNDKIVIMNASRCECNVIRVEVNTRVHRAYAEATACVFI